MRAPEAPLLRKEMCSALVTMPETLLQPIEELVGRRFGQERQEIGQ
jgi:hypothetical protein